MSKIVLTMIVRNEAAVIRRCLRSVRPYIHGWAISDTGSTDGTQDIIREELAGIPGELIERPWVDFSTNRNQAIELAESMGADWCLTLDADEWLETKPGFTLKNVTADNVSAPFRIEKTNHTWPRRFLFRPSNRYRGVLDEHLVDNDNQALLPCCLVHSGTDGHRSRDGLRAKFERDAETYRRAIEDEPDNPRYWYYYAQRLAGAQRYDEAIRAYEKRIELGGGFSEEIYSAKFAIAQCMQEVDCRYEDVIEQFRTAFCERPQRAEPLFGIGCQYQANGQPALAEIYFRAAQRMPRPGDSLLIDESVYAWHAADRLAGALAEQGKLAESHNLLTKLLALPQLPDSERERLELNAQDIARAIGTQQTPKDQLGPDELTYQRQAKELRASGPKAFRQLAREYLANYTAQSLPSPARWLWITLVALFGHWATVVPAGLLPAALLWTLYPIADVHPAVVALAAGSPLLWLTARRRFQDPMVALLTLVCVGSALRGEPLWMGAALAAMLCIKEAGVFAIPAMALAWHCSAAPWIGFGASVACASAVAATSIWMLLGEMALPVMRAGSKGHQTPYTKDHQQGAPHRLFVDLLLVSPVCTLASLASGQLWALVITLALVAAHTLAPVRNVRLVLAAELLIRGAVAVALGWYALPLIAVDLFIFHKLRRVYDPVTAALVQGLGMSR